MVVAEVVDIPQVTTRSKGKMMKWEAQEAIRKHATECVEKANEQNANVKQQKEALAKVIDTIQPENPTWQVLQECQITLPLGRLLQ